MKKTRNKELWLLISAVALAAALGSLIYTSFTDSLVYFYTPTELKTKLQTQSKAMEGQKLRIGGMVQEGSLTRAKDSLKIAFLVTDGQTHIPVRHEGMTPDLFREGQGVIVVGVWRAGQPFQADTILAKHSEDYLPVEMSEEGVARAKESILKSLQ